VDAVTINVTPVADLPTLTVANTGPSLLFNTSWETAANSDNTSTAVGGTTFEGWTRVDTPQVLPGGTNAFEVWASGDSQAPASGGNNTVYAAPGNGRNWLELNDASSNVQTIGISRSVATQAGMVYELSFDYAGRPGFTAGYTTISIQLDGVTIATYSSTSGNAALDWKNLKVSFVGDGNTHTLAILTTPTQTDPNGRGAAIDDITLAAYQGVTAGNASGGSLTQIALASYVSAGLTDTDGSETLSLTFGGLPAGAQIVTSSNTYNVSGGSITIQGSELASAKLQLASSYTGVLDVTVSATATETVGGATATTSTQTLEFHVQPASGVVTATDQTDASAVRLGTDAVDSLSGNNSANLMEGYAGNDTLDGGGGADLLVGGAGTDTITGGAGADTFKWSLADRGTVAAPATDTITDFDTTATSDKLDLRDLLVGELHSGTAAGNLADYLHFSYSAATGTTIDVKSVGSSLAGPDQKIILTGVDITSGNTLSDTAIIQNLLTNGKLIVD
jgi:Ca2+-binding RTX toxin-like protein